MNSTTIIAILRVLRRLLTKQYSPLPYTNVSLDTPLVTHQIQPYLTLKAGKCNYPHVDSSAYAHSKGHGYSFYFNYLYIFVEIEDEFYSA